MTLSLSDIGKNWLRHTWPECDRPENGILPYGVVRATTDHKAVMVL